MFAAEFSLWIARGCWDTGLIGLYFRSQTSCEQLSLSRSNNIKAYLKSGCLYLMALTLPMAIFVTMMLAMMEGVLNDLMGKELTGLLKWYTMPIQKFMSSYPSDTQMYGGLGLVLTTFLLLLLARWLGRTNSTMTRRQKRQLLDKQEFVRFVLCYYSQCHYFLLNSNLIKT